MKIITWLNSNPARCCALLTAGRQKARLDPVPSSEEIDAILVQATAEHCAMYIDFARELRRTKNVSRAELKTLETTRLVARKMLAACDMIPGDRVLWLTGEGLDATIDALCALDSGPH